MPTHGIARQGAGSDTAGTEVKIGANITIPANGPWLIIGVWIMVVTSTVAAEESIIGWLHIDSISGDITPDPAPGRYPIISSNRTNIVANIGESTNLQIFPVQWTAPGKSKIALYHHPLNSMTDAPHVACGIIFDRSAPLKQPLTFSDAVTETLSTTTETLIGTITLSEKATRIVGIYADLAPYNLAAVDEGVIATVRLDSDDIELTPAQFPCARGYGATQINAQLLSSTGPLQFIPLDIPTPSGARISCFTTLNSATSSDVRSTIYLAYT